MWWSQVKIREMQHDQHWGKEHSFYLSLKHWDNLPREAVKSTLVLKDFQWSSGDHPERSDLPLKLAWLSGPLWPKLLWLMNQSATSWMSQPPACWPQAGCQLISTNKGCGLHKLPEGVVSHVLGYSCLSLERLPGHARSTEPCVLMKWHWPSGQKLPLYEGAWLEQSKSSGQRLELFVEIFPLCTANFSHQVLHWVDYILSIDYWCFMFCSGG